MKLHPLVRTSAIAAVAALLSQPSAAQERAGSVFLQIFNVGGVDETLGNQSGLSGSIGCGNGAPNDSENPTSLFASDGDIFTFCGNLTTAPEWDTQDSRGEAAAPEAITRMEEALAPTQGFMQTDQAAALAGLQIDNVTQRIAQIRLTRRGLEDLGGFAFERSEEPEWVLGLADARGLRAPESSLAPGAFAAALERGFSSGDGLLGIEGLAAFFNGEYTRIDASESSNEAGSEGNGGGFTLGLDKQLGEKAFLGLAFGYSYLATDFDHDFGDSNLNDITFSSYGSVFFGEHVYLDGILSGSILLFDQERKVPSGVMDQPDFEIESDPEGWNITGDLGVGGEFSLKPFDLNPYLRVAVSQTEVDSYDEHGSSLALDIDEQENTSVTLTPGLSVSLPVSTSFGVVSPYVRGEYVHEFGDQADDIRGNLSLIPDASFELTPNNTDEDYAHAGAGVATTLGKGISVFADYDVLLAFSDLVVHKATIGGRFEF